MDLYEPPSHTGSRRRKTWCKICRKDQAEVGLVSARGKCAVCGEALALENFRQLAAHSGPMFDHWRRRTLAAFGVVLLDEPPREV